MKLTGDVIVDNLTTKTLSVGIDKNSKIRLLIVEPWQSNRPIKIKENLWVSLEEHLIDPSEIKRDILDVLSESEPDIYLKVGADVESLSVAIKFGNAYLAL